MLRFSALVAVSALMLAACSQSGNSQPSTSSSQTSTQKTTAAGSACRSMGEGHKVNGKGQNDIYMCKVDVALNSAEAKSALDPSIRVHYGSTSGATLTSRQISNSVGKTPDETCQRAFLSAVKRFQSTAHRKKAKSVHLVSYFDKVTKGGNEYECHIATFNMKFGIFLFYGYDTPSLPTGRSVFCRLLRPCVSKHSRFTTFGCHAATGAASRLASQPRIKTANRFTGCIAEPQPRLCRFIVCASALNSRSRYRIYPPA